MDAIDILTRMESQHLRSAPTLTSIPLLLAQAIDAIADKLRQDEIERLIAIGAALCAHNHDVAFCSIEIDMLGKEISVQQSP